MGIISTNADGLSELIEKLGLKDATLISLSAGGGEVARYIGRHGSAISEAGQESNLEGPQGRIARYRARPHRPTQCRPLAFLKT